MTAGQTRTRHTSHRTPAAHGGAVTTAPWRRAPLLLLRQPVVFFAIVGAAAILAVAAASGPLFLSTIGTASFTAQAEQRCPEDGQPTVRAMTGGTSVAPISQTGLQQYASRGYSNAYVATDGYTTVGSSLVHLFSRQGALDHVKKLTPDTGAAGVWVPNVFAAKVGAKPGKVITTADGRRMRVAGIYRDLAPNPFALSHLSRYWCTYTNQIVATVASDQSIASSLPLFRQGPWLIADQATVAKDSSQGVEVLWSAPMPASSNPLSRYDLAATQATDIAHEIGIVAHPDPDLAQLTATAHTARNGIAGSIVPIEIAGVIVAAILVGGAGLFWASARQREVRLLVARGVGPLPLAVKAVLETIAPAIIGAVLGYFATSWLVRRVGPSDTLESNAPTQALTLVIGTLVLGLALIGLIGGLSGRDRTVGHRTPLMRLVPWEILLLGAALWLGFAQRGESAVTVDHTVVKISALVVLYPLLGATAALLLVGRVVGLLLPGVGRRAGRKGNTRYLALRRISRSRAIAIGVIVGTALPCCLLMYGSTVTNTVSNEVTQKYETNLGAPHVLQIYGVHGALFDPHGTGTQAVVYQQDAEFDANDPVNVLGINTETFQDFAFTNSDQRDAISKLSADSPQGTVPAIVVNRGSSPDTTQLKIGATSLQLNDVAQLAVFPGLRNSAYPLVVVDQRSLTKVDPNADRLNQLWTDDAHYAAGRAYLAAHDYTVLFQLTSDVVVGTTGLLPVTWLFGYLRALAILIGVVAVAGLIFGLASRTRRRRVSYVLSRRMGMSKLAHLNSLLIELLIVVGLGWVAGSALGVGSFRFIYQDFDVYPDLKPPASFAIPTLPIQVTAGIVVAIVVLAAVATHLLAERTKPSEILRLE
jgi:putative ABC transport system permease protein